MQTPAAQRPAEQYKFMNEEHGTPNSNSESSPPPQLGADKLLGCGKIPGPGCGKIPGPDTPVEEPVGFSEIPAPEVPPGEDPAALPAFEMEELALVVAMPKPGPSLWGMYSSTVLQQRGRGDVHGRRCVSPTRGARELAKILKSESGSVDGSPSGSTEAPCSERDAEGSSSSEMQPMPSMLPLEDGDVEEAPEIARARNRAARARENAARAVERARAQRAAEVAAQAAAKVRRRIAGKQKSPPAFPPAPTAGLGDPAAAAKSPAKSASEAEPQRSPAASAGAAPASPEFASKRKVAGEGDMPTPPSAKMRRQGEEPNGSPGVIAKPKGRGRGAVKQR